LVASPSGKGGFVLTAQTLRRKITFTIKLIDIVRQGSEYRCRVNAPIGVHVMTPPVPPVFPGVDRLEAYASSYRGVFSRADQARWLHVYLQGLLDGDHRKNVESIARRVRPPEGSSSAVLAQALQNFVSHSPWDARRLAARYRELVGPAVADAGSWVIHDGTFPKRGRHSVGVQRQYARQLGRKINCQVAVVVGALGPAGYVPLAVRLYLPVYWLRENQALAEKTVPPEHRRPLSKSEIALELLDELRAEGRTPPAVVAAEDGYDAVAAFAEGLAQRGLTPLAADNPGRGRLLTEAVAGFEAVKERLGMNHFEGRSWLGWHHHVSLALAAFGFLLEQRATAL
jgi:SRSO17 transposase